MSAQQQIPNWLAAEIQRVLKVRRFEQSLYVFIAGLFLVNLYFAPSLHNYFSAYTNPGVIAFGAISTAVLAGSFAAAAIYASNIFSSSRIAAARRLYWVVLLVMGIGVLSLIVAVVAFNYVAYHYVAGDISPNALAPIADFAFVVATIASAMFDVFYIFSSAMLFAESRAKLFIAAAVLFTVVLLIDVLPGTTDIFYDGFGLAWLIFVIAVRRYRRRLATELAAALKQQP